MRSGVGCPGAEVWLTRVGAILGWMSDGVVTEGGGLWWEVTKAEAN